MILYSAGLSNSKPTAVAVMYVRTVRVMLLREFGCGIIRLGTRTSSNSVRFQFGSIHISRLVCRRRFRRLLFKTGDVFVLCGVERQPARRCLFDRFRLYDSHTVRPRQRTRRPPQVDNRPRFVSACASPCSVGVILLLSPEASLVIEQITRQHLISCVVFSSRMSDHGHV